MQNTAPFAKELRKLMDMDKSRKRYLTAAPQCPYPDRADEDILNNPGVRMDAVWVQFYNNYCGVNAYEPTSDSDSGSSSTSKSTTYTPFDFAKWNHWAKNVSKNPNVKVLLGVPANTGAASTGYLPAPKLKPVIDHVKQFSNFGGVMMWDVSQAYANQGFLDGIASALGKAAGTASEHALRLRYRLYKWTA